MTKISYTIEQARAYIGTLLIFLISFAIALIGAFLGYYEMVNSALIAGAITVLMLFALLFSGRMARFVEFWSAPFLEQVPFDVIEGRVQRAFDHFVLWHEKQGGSADDKLQMRACVHQPTPGGHAHLSLFFKVGDVNYISCYRDKDLQRTLHSIVLPHGVCARSYAAIRYMRMPDVYMNLNQSMPIQFNGRVSDLSNHARLRISAEAANLRSET